MRSRSLPKARGLQQRVSVMWGLVGGGTHARPSLSSCLTPTSDSHFNFRSPGFLIQEGRYYITSFISLKRLVFTHPFILSSQPASQPTNTYWTLISESWEYLPKLSQPPSSPVPVGGGNENSYLARRLWLSPWPYHPLSIIAIKPHNQGHKDAPWVKCWLCKSMYLSSDP